MLKLKTILAMSLSVLILTACSNDGENKNVVDAQVTYEERMDRFNATYEDVEKVVGAELYSTLDGRYEIANNLKEIGYNEAMVIITMNKLDIDWVDRGINYMESNDELSADNKEVYIEDLKGKGYTEKEISTILEKLNLN